MGERLSASWWNPTGRRSWRDDLVNKPVQDLSTRGGDLRVLAGQSALISMPKLPNLELAITAAVRPTSRRLAPSLGLASGRQGTVGITIHVAPEVRAQLKIIALERGMTVHSLLCDALNAISAAAHKPEIAR